MLGLISLALLSLPASLFCLPDISQDPGAKITGDYSYTTTGENIFTVSLREDEVDCRNSHFPDVFGFKGCLERIRGEGNLGSCSVTMDTMKLANDVLECTLQIIVSLRNSGSSLYLIKRLVTDACNRLGCGDLVNATYGLCDGGAKNGPLKDCSKIYVNEREACGNPFVISVPAIPKIERCLKPSRFSCKYSQERSVQLLEEFSQAITCLYSSMADSYPEETSKRLSCKVIDLLWAILDLNLPKQSPLLKQFRGFMETSCMRGGSV